MFEDKFLGLAFEINCGVEDPVPQEGCLTEIEGKIYFNVEKNIVGRISAYIIHIDHARDLGERLSEICGSHGHELNGIYPSIFDYSSDSLKENLPVEEFCVKDKVLVISSIQILPEHRGKGLGYWTLRRLLMNFGGTTTLLVMEPCPLQYEQNDAAWEAAMKPQLFKRGRREGRKRLIEHWQRLGFSKFGRLLVYDIAEGLPNVERLLRGPRLVPSIHPSQPAPQES